MKTIEIKVHPTSGVPDCDREVAPEGEDVEWYCNHKEVIHWEIWFNKNGCPFDTTQLIKADPGRKALPDTARPKDRPYKYRVTVWTKNGSKHKDPPLDIVPRV